MHIKIYNLRVLNVMYIGITSFNNLIQNVKKLTCIEFA